MAYLYEYIRTRGVEPLYFERHFERFKALVEDNAIYPTTLSRKELLEDIRTALKRKGYSGDAVNAVCLKYDLSTAKTTIDIEEIFYKTFSVRAMRPKGEFLYTDGKPLVEQTSVRRAMCEYNRLMAQKSGDYVALWINSEGELYALDGASVVVVFDDEIRFSSLGSGVEFELAYKAMAKRSVKVSKGPITVEELAGAKEVLGIDHRGIVALEAIDSHYYMDVTARIIADEVAALEAK